MQTRNTRETSETNVVEFIGYVGISCGKSTSRIGGKDLVNDG